MAVGTDDGSDVTVGCGDIVGCDVGARSKQTCHPASYTKLSEYHDMLVLGVTETPSGPELYWLDNPLLYPTPST